MSLSVQSDVKQLSKKIASQYRRQIPYVTSRALNNTAFSCRKVVQAALPKYIDRPTPYTMRSVQVKKSDKKNLNAYIGFASKTFGKLPGNASIPPAEYMARLTKGGTRKARSKYIAIPSSPRQLNKFGGLKRGAVSRLLSNKKKYFLGRPNAHEHWGFGVWARVGKKGRGNIQKVIKFAKETQYDKQFPFNHIVMKEIKKVFQREFKKEFL